MMPLNYGGNWWALLLRAGVAILFGILAFTLPGLTLAAIVLIFGIYAIVDGVLELIAAFRGLRRQERWAAMMVEGVVGIIVGCIALFWPQIGALALVYLVAVWALVTGALELAAAVKLRSIITGEWLLILGGILSIILAFLIALFPTIGASVLIWWLGAYAILYGIVVLILSFRVRRWSRATHDLDTHP